MTSLKSNDEIRDSVRTAYAAVAETASGCCGLVTRGMSSTSGSTR